MELGAARAERDGFRAELEAARAARDRAQAELAAAREEAYPGGFDLGGEEPPTAPADAAALRERALQQAQAAARAAGQPPPEADRMVADIDAAAATLRNGAEPREEPPPEAEERPVPEPPRRWLRHALVRFADEDPPGAAELLAGLLPAQGPVIKGPLDYDLTIHEIGTFAIKIRDGQASAQRVPEPRRRRDAAFHVQTDARTLAGLIAGTGRVRRFRGPARLAGSRRKARVLNLLLDAEMTLAEVARAGARLDPAPIFSAFRYAIHPTWTKGHAFTVAQTIRDEPDQEQTWYIHVRDGKPIAVLDLPPATGVDATVTMSRDAYAAMLRGETPPAGERPNVRGDYQAVALLKQWTDRARGVRNER